MGKIIFKKTEELWRRKVFDEVPITNWRTVSEMDENKIEVVIARLHRFIIHDLTIDYFHETNKHRYIIERAFDYINSPLGCSMCLGSGRVDWIQKARSARGPAVIDLVRNYVRNPNVINDLMTLKQDRVNLYGSQPRIYDGQEVCGHCNGTGLESITPLNESIMR